VKKWKAFLVFALIWVKFHLYCVWAD